MHDRCRVLSPKEEEALSKIQQSCLEIGDNKGRITDMNESSRSSSIALHHGLEGGISMPYERRWLAVSAIGLSVFLSALDATIVALALPPIAHQFQLSESLASTVTLS